MTTPKPYFVDERAGIQLFHGDCRDVLPWIARHYTTDLLLADPPYGIDFNPGGGSTVTPKTFIKGERIIGDTELFDPTHVLYLKTKTVLWGANYFADKLPPSPSWLVWYKKEGLPNTSYADCEVAWSNLGGPARVYSHTWNGMIRASERGVKRRHPAAKPVALMRWCIQRAGLKPGALVVDPYMGSGPIAQAAKELGMRYIGIELVEAYVNVAIGRLQQEVMLF